MVAASSLHPAPALLAREARARRGIVPRELGGVAVPPGSTLLHGESYLLRTTTGYGLFYRKGEGVIVERDADADPAEESLWLNGSVYAAIAAINGFLPFHASAVVWEGKAHAFSGPSGAGKSTLAAALGRHGLPLLCDDTLVLDICDPDQILCLPGHKRLKLTEQAIALTGAIGQEKVAPRIDKHYAQPAGGTISTVLPLASLTFLEDGEQFAVEPIRGAARVARLNDDHYTADLYAEARDETFAGQFARLARLSAGIPMQHLIRPRDLRQFEAVTSAVAKLIKEGRLP